MRAADTAMYEGKHTGVIVQAQPGHAPGRAANAARLARRHPLPPSRIVRALRKPDPRCAPTRGKQCTRFVRRTGIWRIPARAGSSPTPNRAAAKDDDHA
jgi:hypothetical protein